MKLELKHLAPYLPYGLMGANYDKKHSFELLTISKNLDIDIIDSSEKWDGENHLGWNLYYKDKLQFYPMLCPLSKLPDAELINIGLLIRDIKKYKGTYKDKILAIEDAKAWIKGGMKPVLSLSQVQEITEYLYSIHADLYKLIDAGLAIEKQKSNK